MSIVRHICRNPSHRHADRGGGHRPVCRSRLRTTSVKYASILFVFLIELSIGVAHGQDAENPLGELFRRIDQGIRDAGEEMERAKSGRDQLDVRPVQRSESERLLKQAQSLTGQSRWHDAVEVLQFLLNEPTDAFAFRSQREFQSLQEEIDKTLGNLPEEGRRNYLNRYTAHADRVLEEARQAQDLDLLRQVFKKYGHTPAGQTALRLSARLLEDQGEFLQSAELWQRLAKLTTGEEQARNNERAARLLLRAGRKDMTRKLSPKLTEEEIENLQQSWPDSNSDQNETAQSASPYLTFPDRQFSGRPPEPVLAARWNQSLVERYRIRTRFQELIGELEDLEIAPVSTAQPLVVGDVVAYRSLRSLQVRNIADGALVWERRLPESPEQMLTAAQFEQEDELDDIDFHAESRRHRLASHRLANLAYRDEIYGALSSDGIRLFFVDAPGGDVFSDMEGIWNRFDDEQTSPPEGGTNELVACDLKTGRPLWRIGGVKVEERFSRPLAGTFFLGPPVASGEGLYVLGETDGEVTLYCLSPQTGETRWAQPLAAPGRPMGGEPVRMQWLCRPVIADGVIVCPTGCGWVVAVDQVTQRLRWTTRYSPRVEQARRYRGRYVMQSIQPINRRWHATVPVVANGRVLLTPPELPDEFGAANPLLYCLDLFTGKMLWEQTKVDRSNGTMLYLAGHFNDLAILVGTNSVTARKISGIGEIEWSVSLSQPPCGRGVIINDRLLLPVNANQLLSIDLAQGKLDKTFPLTETGMSLGNLTFGENLLISMNYEHLCAFPVDNEVGGVGSHPELLLKRDLNTVRQQLASSDWKSALPLLEQIRNRPEITATEQQKQEMNALRFDGLALRLATESDSRKTLQELEKVATQLDQIPRYQRLVAEQLLKGGDWSQALELLLNHFEQSSPNDRVTEGTRTVRIDGWIGGRLQKLFLALPDNDAQARFNEKISARLERLPQDRIIRDRWARALSFHRLGQQLEWELAQSDFQEQRISDGLIRTRRLAGAFDSTLKLEALRLQAEQLSLLGWHKDALECWNELATGPAATLSGGRSSVTLANEGIARSQKQLEQVSDSSLWQGEWKIERLGLATEESSKITVAVTGSGYHQLDSLGFQVDSSRHRLRVEEGLSGVTQGTFPLRKLKTFDHTAARRQGPYTFILNQGVLHQLDWTSRQIAWDWSPDLHGAALGRASIIPSSNPIPFQTLSQFLVSHQNVAVHERTGYLAAATDRALILLCRDWVALDPLSGEELWRDTNVPERAFVYPEGLNRFLIQGPNIREIRREIDGLTINDEVQLELLRRSFTVIDGDFISLQRRSAQGNGKVGGSELQRVSPNGTVVWSHSLPADIWLKHVDPQTIFWLSHEQELFFVDLCSGKQQLLGKLNLRNRYNQPPLQILSDTSRFYVLLDDGNAPMTYFNLQGDSVTGSILAYDRSGTELWNYEIPTQSRRPGPSRRRRTDSQKWPLKLLSPDFSKSPLLLLAGDVSEHSDDLYFHRIRLIGLDKQTGKPVIDWDRPSETGGFSHLNVNLEQQTIELRTFNERFLLKTVPEPVN